MEEIKTTLSRKRAGLKHRLTTFSTRINDLKVQFESGELKEQWVELELRVTKNEGLLLEYEEIQTQIEAIISEDSLEEQFLERDKFERAYFIAISAAKQLLSKRPTDNVSLVDEVGEVSQFSGPGRQSVSNNIKLPTINLPKFSGTYDAWLEFKDTFSSLIHENSAINNIQKYHYLRASLEGNAAKIIQSIDFTATNYDLAWQLILERYDNKHLLVKNHVKEIFSLNVTTRETSNSLRELIDNICKHVRALKNLQQPVESWDTLLIYIINTKINEITASEWERDINRKRNELKTESTEGNEFPTLDEFLNFLRARANLLETIEQRSKESNKFEKSKPKCQRNTMLLSNQITCNFCKGQHLIYECSNFLKLPVHIRKEKATEARLCMNCLKTGHPTKKCRSGGCRICRRWHNSLLHQEEETPKESPSMKELKTSFTATCNSSISQVLLATACVKVKDCRGNFHQAKAILDSGSQSNFISREFCQRLQLEEENVNVAIVGFNQVQSKINSKTILEIISTDGQFKTKLSSLVIPTISDDLPAQSFWTEDWNIPKNINLADPQFMQTSKIDLLLGAGLFWQLILPNKLNLGKGKPVLQKTRLGWIISGSLIANSGKKKLQCNLSSNFAIQNALQKFWEIEEVSDNPEPSNEEIECERHFQENTTRQSNGRFTVSIPLKKSPEILGESRNAALKRLFSLERKFKKNKYFKEKYLAFMKDYEDTGHMKLVQDSSSKEEDVYYLPHHGVMNSESSTTKLRVVFDASAQTTSGYSFNDIQAVGPKIQEDLFSILLRFRQHRYVLSADVKQMYRQIDVVETQRSLQRILWRYDASQELATYELKTVTYGTAAAPFLAIRSLYQLGLDNENEYPLASEKVKRDFYVDDLVTGAATLEEILSIKRDVTDILQRGCMELRKWKSNNLSILHNEIEDNMLTFEEKGDNTSKTLGIGWLSNQDVLTYTVTTNLTNEITKRSILSTIAKIFDPLGLLSPCILLAKIILQLVWQHQLDWDEETPPEIQRNWQTFRNDLHLLNDLQIERHTCINVSVKMELHGFCDASEKAYGACIYVRSINEQGDTKTKLLCAKGKVAPLKKLTVPRLELTSAMLLARLMKQVKRALCNADVTTIYWSDSQVTLCWIRTEPNILQPYVSNRVTQIQSLSDIKEWRYIPTKDNPADILSRGLLPSKIRVSDTWWNGPKWLREEPDNWPEVFRPVWQGEVPEVKKRFQVSILTTYQKVVPFERVSSYVKLRRILAYCLRFITICRGTETLTKGPINTQEIKTAEAYIIKAAQYECFQEEIDLLKQDKELPKSNKLVGLSPFLDSQGLLRVGGRLNLSTFAEEKKHPYLLSNKHRLATLILEGEHEKLLHAGPQLLLANVREKFWIVSARNLARKIVRSCTKCIRFNPKMHTPIMGHLPKERVTPSFPFEVTGVDYAGPFNVRDRIGRGKGSFKVYICLFICFSTRAIHLELVTCLSTEGFLATLKRFMARRGKPRHIFSDNGRNFLGATSQLKDLGIFLTENFDNISNAIANQETEWHFIPPYTPNFGGLWEAGVKSVKFHLKRVIGNTILSIEDFLTIITQIEGILNSRPLCVLSTDPNEYQALTPSHFLIGRSMSSISEDGVSNIPSGRLNRFQHLQLLKEHFWKRWSKEYISSLQQRTKWKVHQHNVKTGDIVLLKQDNLPPSVWPLGRIIDTHPGLDGIVRVVTVKTSNSVVKRPVNKMCTLFPLEESGY